MHTTLSKKFAPSINAMSVAELEGEINNPSELLLGSTNVRDKLVQVAFAPFDYLNERAAIVIVGLTPGRQQMGNALREWHRQLRAGATFEQACSAAKVFGSFSGPLRANLVRLLDYIGVAKHLGIQSTGSLWGADHHLAHFTSALRYPVFVDGDNYSGAPDMLSTPLLTDQVDSYLAAEMRALPNALYVPLGPKVTAAVEYAAGRVGLNLSQVLSGLPHPSGANAERIAYFLGEKPRDALSSRTNPALLDSARETLTGKLVNLKQGEAHV